MPLSACTSGPTEVGRLEFMSRCSLSLGPLTYSSFLLLFRNLKEVTTASHDLCVRRTSDPDFGFPVVFRFLCIHCFLPREWCWLNFSVQNEVKFLGT